MHHTQGFFKSVGGLKLHYQSCQPQHQTQAIVILLHGLGSHSGRFNNVIQYLVPAGYTVYALDLRGHGRSTGLRGHLNDWSEYRADLSRFLQVIDEQCSNCPRFVLGHSLGGMIALDYGLRFPTALQGIITIAPALGLNGISSTKLWLANTFSRIAPRFRLKVGIDLEAISRDREVLNDCTQDPLVHSIASARFGSELFKTIAWVESQAANLQVPLLILHGGDDVVAHPEGSQAFFEQLTLSDKERHEYPGSRHAPHNDINYEELLIDLERWLDRQIQQTTRLQSVC
ncbi:alpha/beta hydrolase [Leptolyngbya sp. NIES-2104]|uniref:alpha/beta hydrolase n=1 Tax=Leptolyngbya sp. NIES-2104 TaxID=1552121 RepID=UPI0006ECA005|nr:alpha/beta hydrolase [Leptolyngbya sp. NIES-2104]GAP98947.1 lysophospholipase / monoglyceride lipase [Leptolyngbya sp. NIES-2104]